VSGDAPILELVSLLVRRGGATVLEVPRLALAPGETLAVIGPNGAGKSTLLLAMAGIAPPDGGRVLFRGADVHAGGSLAYRRRVAMAFQEPLLFDTTVIGNVEAGLRIRDLPRREVRERAVASLERFRIGHLAGRAARTLSGGEARRASLARAFAVAPEILLLDEPFAGLDPPAREALLADLGSTLGETGTTCVFVTHTRRETERLARRVALLEDGRLRRIGPVAEVLRSAGDGFVAAFLGGEDALQSRG
jgi:tungstate transport system ATP-binding protein